MPERDYRHRDVLDKLGIKPGQAIAFEEVAGRINPELCARALARAGRPEAAPDEQVEVALIALDSSVDARAVLRRWRDRLDPAGGIWLLTPKRGREGYVDQTSLIPEGAGAGLVDNKTCSVSETTSGMRFVIRRKDRPLQR